MGASYPGSVWDGDMATHDGELRAPNGEDWGRAIAEIAAAQTQVDTNIAGLATNTAAVATNAAAIATNVTNIATNASGIATKLSSLNDLTTLTGNHTTSIATLNDRVAGIDADTEHSVGTKESTTGMVTTEKGDGAVHKTVINLTEVEMITTDGTTPANDGAWGTTKLYTFPKGHINLISCAAEFPLGGLEAVGSSLAADADFELGLGSTAAAQATQFDLQAAEENLSSAAMVCALTAKTSDELEKDVQTTLAELDGSTTAIPVYLNMRTRADGDHDTSADVLKVTGKITLLWSLITKGY